MAASCNNDACGRKEDEETKLKTCGVCKSARYCSVECQKSHWPSHKKSCHRTAYVALIRAIGTNDTDTIRRLAKTKQVVNGSVEGVKGVLPPPLHECLGQDNLAAMQLLIDGGCVNPNVKDDDGDSILFLAANSRKTPEFLSTLLLAGADPNSTTRDGFSALVVSVRDGNYENIKLLLEYGASLYVGSAHGRGALELAESYTSGLGALQKFAEQGESAKEKYQRIHQLLLQYAQ